MSNRNQPFEYRVEEIGDGFAVQRLYCGEHRDEDRWATIGRWDQTNKCVLFGRDEALSIAFALTLEGQRMVSEWRRD